MLAVIKSNQIDHVHERIVAYQDDATTATAEYLRAIEYRSNVVCNSLSL